MHRARMSAETRPGYNWYTPKIRFIRLPCQSLDKRGSFDNIVRDLVNKAALASGTEAPEDIPGTSIMPVHEMQLSTVLEKFEKVEVLEPAIGALAQSSIRRVKVEPSPLSTERMHRTVLVPALTDMSLKLSINMKISSALRTISHWTADFGPRFSRDIVPKLAVDHKIFSVELEPASAVFKGEKAMAKHMTAIFRNEFVPPPGENVVVVAALLEMGHAGVPAGVSAVEYVFGLDTEAKRIAFLDRYV